jgi:hypothetical protein
MQAQQLTSLRSSGRSMLRPKLLAANSRVNGGT